MFTDIQGAWPTHERMILVSCDETYFNRYFPRFYKTFTKHWQLPIHAHLIDPSKESLARLAKLGVSHTWCQTEDYDWHNAVAVFKKENNITQRNHETVKQWLYECYCQCQRFVVMGSRMTEKQSVIVADVDAYAQKTPSEEQMQLLFSCSAFTEFNGRLMATFCHFHPDQLNQIRRLSSMIVDRLTRCFVQGLDQKALKELFRTARIDLKHIEWIRHLDIKGKKDLKQHAKGLIYHEKGRRGKIKHTSVLSPCTTFENVIGWENME